MHRSDEPRRGGARGARPGRGGWVDDAPPVTADEVTTAADAGWAEAPPIATGSWVRAAGAYVDPAPLPEPSEPALAAGVAPAPSRGADTVHDRGGRWDATEDLDGAGHDDPDVTGWTGLDDAARRAAMARHPAFQNQHRHPTEHAAAAPGSATGDAAAGELLERLARGAARAADEAQLRSLAARALARLVPDGSVTWLARDGDGRIMTWATTTTGHPDGACRVQRAESCPATSTGALQVFDRSDELDACPHLVDDDRPACATTCIPADGGAVLLVRTPIGRPCPAPEVGYLGRAAALLAARAEALRTGG